MRWSDSEDALLLRLKTELIGSDGDTDWHAVAKRIPGRNPKQARERYYSALDPALNKGPWSEEEVEKLYKLIEDHGTQWATIASLLGTHRSELNIRNVYYSRQRKEERNAIRQRAANRGVHGDDERFTRSTRSRARRSQEEVLGENEELRPLDGSEDQDEGQEGDEQYTGDAWAAEDDDADMGMGGQVVLAQEQGHAEASASGGTGGSVGQEQGLAHSRGAASARGGGASHVKRSREQPAVDPEAMRSGGSTTSSSLQADSSKRLRKEQSSRSAGGAGGGRGGRRGSKGHADRPALVTGMMSDADAGVYDMFAGAGTAQRQAELHARAAAHEAAEAATAAAAAAAAEAALYPKLNDGEYDIFMSAAAQAGVLTGQRYRRNALSAMPQQLTHSMAHPPAVPYFGGGEPSDEMSSSSSSAAGSRARSQGEYRPEDVHMAGGGVSMRVSRTHATGVASSYQRGGGGYSTAAYSAQAGAMGGYMAGIEAAATGGGGGGGIWVGVPAAMVGTAAGLGPGGAGGAMSAAEMEKLMIMTADMQAQYGLQQRMAAMSVLPGHPGHLHYAGSSGVAARLTAQPHAQASVQQGPGGLHVAAIGNQAAAPTQTSQGGNAAPGVQGETVLSARRPGFVSGLMAEFGDAHTVPRPLALDADVMSMPIPAAAQAMLSHRSAVGVTPAWRVSDADSRAHASPTLMYLIPYPIQAGSVPGNGGDGTMGMAVGGYSSVGGQYLALSAADMTGHMTGSTARLVPMDRGSNVYRPTNTDSEYAGGVSTDYNDVAAAQLLGSGLTPQSREYSAPHASAAGTGSFFAQQQQQVYGKRGTAGMLIPAQSPTGSGSLGGRGSVPGPGSGYDGFSPAFGGVAEATLQREKSNSHVESEWGKGGRHRTGRALAAAASSGRLSEQVAEEQGGGGGGQGSSWQQHASTPALLSGNTQSSKFDGSMGSAQDTGMKAHGITRTSTHSTRSGAAPGPTDPVFPGSSPSFAAQGGPGPGQVSAGYWQGPRLLPAGADQAMSASGGPLPVPPGSVAVYYP